MIQSLPCDEIRFDRSVEDILNTEDNSDVGYILKVDLSYPDEPDELRAKTKRFPFCPENKVSPHDTSSDYVNKVIQKLPIIKKANL